MKDEGITRKRVNVIVGGDMAGAWLARLLFAGLINGFGVPRSEQNHRRSSAGLGRWIAGPCVGLGVLFCSSTHAQELNDVALLFLKLHRVSCLTVIKVGTVVLDEVVTCEDGRKWMLFWLENEVAFVNPETHELYKWQWELNERYPQLYNASPRTSYGPRRKFVTPAATDHLTTPNPP